MASVSLKLVLLLVSVFLLLKHSTAQEFYEDVGNLEQYSPLLGENIFDYPMLEEYGIPTVEEFPSDNLDADDDGDVKEDNYSHETQGEKESEKHQDNEHAPKKVPSVYSKADAREKRQLPLQDDPVVVAREKLQRAIKAAKALSNIENELGLSPMTIEDKTKNLENQLKDEEKSFKKLADQTEDKQRKQKFVKLEKVADEDVNQAESILKLIVKLEAAKYLAKERAHEDLVRAQKDKIASTPQMYLGPPLSYPPEAAGYFGGVTQPAYQTVMPSYTASYQPQTFQAVAPPSMAPATTSELLPPSLPAPSNVAPLSTPHYQDNTELQRINSIKETSVSAFSPQSNNQLSGQSVQPKGGQVVSFSTDASDTKINPADIDFIDMESPSSMKKPETQTSGSSPKTPSSGHGNDVIEPQKDVSAPKPPPRQQPAKLVASHQPVAPPQPPKPTQLAIASVQAVPAQPVKPFLPAAPAQPITMPFQTMETGIGQQNGFLTQSAPLAVSYSPNALSPNLASMSRYFNSPSSVLSSFATQPYHQPLPSVQAPQQNFVPHAQPKKPQPKAPELVKPEVTPNTAFNDQPQVMTPPSPVSFQPAAHSTAHSGEQVLSEANPSGSLYSWSTQPVLSSNPQYSWNSPMYYPPASPYQAPVNPLIAEAYRKLHDTERASLAMSKIEEAIGLSPSSVRHIVDDIETQAKMETTQYEDDMKNEKAEITQEKQLLQKDKTTDGAQVKKKIQDDEEKIREDIRKENIAKLEVDKIKKMEKILTIIEAAKYSAMQRAKKRINNLKTDDGLSDGEDIRKRDLQDLENDIKRRRRNEINIWLKGSRNRIDTSHFLRNRISGLKTNREERSGWNSDDNKDHHLSKISEKDKLTKEGSTEGRLQKLKFFNTLSSNKKLDAGQQFTVGKRTDVPVQPENSPNAFVMAKMLNKMDKLFTIQREILKYLKAEHTINTLRKKPHAKRWRRSLYKSKNHKKTPKDANKKRSVNKEKDS
ncbi:proteoglycan 4-like isoform X1 [Stylophora pistillata]|uniref:proteoglycan 4-like isoform X1 n=1 Tax=Stylophora pistillata TaxID=50429 RepID=UPI000C04DD40|nr:proteoglycan 4-like isoform X1 [Stylophora pistillata]